MARFHRRQARSISHVCRLFRATQPLSTGFLTTSPHPPPTGPSSSPRSPLGDRLPSYQAGYHSSTRFPLVTTFERIPHSQTYGGVSHDSESQTSQYVDRCSPVPHGIPFGNPSSTVSVRLGDKFRPEGCLPSCPNRRFVHPAPRVSRRRTNVLLPGTALRHQDSSVDLYTNRTSCRGGTSEEGPPPFLLSGRLASGCPIQNRPPTPPGSSPAGHHGPRFFDQLGEVRPRTDPTPNLPRGGSRLTSDTGTTRGPSHRISDHTDSLTTPPPVGPGESLAPSSRTHGQSGRLGRGLSVPYARYTNACTSSLPTHPRLSQEADSHVRGSSQVPALVVTSGPFTGRETVPTSSPDRDYLDGCIPPRVGCSSRGAQTSRDVAQISEPSSHQQAGIACGHISPQRLPSSYRRQIGPSQIRQCDRCGLHKPPGWHSVTVPLPSNPSPIPVDQTSPHSLASCLHTGQGEYLGGFSLPESSIPDGVATQTIRCRPPLPALRHSSGRSIRVHSQCAAPSILHSLQRTSGMGDGRFLNYVDGVPRIRFPPVSSSSAGAREDQPRRGERSSSGPFLATSPLVSPARRSSGGDTDQALTTPRSSQPTGLSHPSPAHGVPTPRVVASLRVQSDEAGLSDRAANMLAESLRHSTRQTYDSRLRPYFSWCDNLSVDPVSCPVGPLCDFFISLFDKGLSLATLRGYRSAVGSIHTGFPDGSTVSSSPFLTKLFRSFFLKRPPARSLLPSWSLPRVLQALAAPPFEPMNDASLMDVSIKTCFLIAVASGQRRSSIHALSTAHGHLRFEPDQVRMIPEASFIAKNQTATSRPCELILPTIRSSSSVPEDKLWCPVRALRWYMSRTKPIRHCPNLFISTVAPHGPASRATISRWLVSAVKAAGGGAFTEASGPIHAHDTRSLAASWALFNGASSSEILQAAYWSSPNTFISTYLKDVVAVESRFGRSALAAVDHDDPR